MTSLQQHGFGLDCQEQKAMHMTICKIHCICQHAQQITAQHEPQLVDVQPALLEGPTAVLAGPHAEAESTRLEHIAGQQAVTCCECSVLEVQHAGTDTLVQLQTYIHWGLHEPEPGHITFSDSLDVFSFLQTAAQLGLHVVLRLGPYICAEQSFGGLPWWLGSSQVGLADRVLAACFRCGQASDARCHMVELNGMCARQDLVTARSARFQADRSLCLAVWSGSCHSPHEQHALQAAVGSGVTQAC